LHDCSSDQLKAFAKLVQHAESIAVLTGRPVSDIVRATLPTQQPEPQPQTARAKLLLMRSAA
jgi:hypothetical protein